MKFGKTYMEFIEKEASVQLAGCSYVKFKKLKKVLKKCTMHDASVTVDGGDVDMLSTTACGSSVSCSRDSRACSAAPGLKAKSSIVTKRKQQRKGAPVSPLANCACPTACPGTFHCAGFGTHL